MNQKTKIWKKRKIIHIDMDSFFASIEIRDNPNLKNKMLGDYLISSQSKFFEYANTLSDWSIGKSVKFYNQSNDLFI